MRYKELKKNKSAPKVAPGLSNGKFGEDASEEDIRRGNYTKVTRVYLDENDPS